MNSAICEKSQLNYFITIYISGTYIRLSHYSQNVKYMTQFAGNQRGLRKISALVGSSETTRVTTIPESLPKSLCQWLAGIIDSNGSFQVNKKGYTSLEIIMGIEDLACLRYIQNKFGGSLKKRMKTYRYRLHNKAGKIFLVSAVNGFILNSKRLPQFHNVCIQLNINLKHPEIPDIFSYWFAGFFDGNGQINISLNKGIPKLKIVVTNKYKQDIIYFKNVFDGNIYYNRRINGIYTCETDIIKMLEYFKSVNFRSVKSKRFFLIKDYFLLKDLEAFKVDSIHHKMWIEFFQKWNRATIYKI